MKRKKSNSKTKTSSKTKNNYKCKLPKFTVKECLSIQDAAQSTGWGITAFNLPTAWAVSQGEGITIAVLDSGIDLDHPDLVENILPGINLINKNQQPDDDNQHGTHVAGIICAENNNIGMVGVAPKAKIIPVKVLDKNGSGDMRVVANGIKWAVDNGADIISMSLGAPKSVPLLEEAVKYATSKGVPIFVAAGNAGLTQQVFYPAAYPECIAVGSIDQTFDRSKFSNTGSELDFMAPGRDIFSTVPDNWYATLSGTSMACPFAVGVAALLMSYLKKKGLEAQVKTPDGMRQMLKKYTTPINGAVLNNNEFFSGFGIIDPQKVIEWIKSNG